MDTLPNKVPPAAVAALERAWLQVLRDLHPDWAWAFDDDDEADAA